MMTHPEPRNQADTSFGDRDDEAPTASAVRDEAPTASVVSAAPSDVGAPQSPTQVPSWTPEPFVQNDGGPVSASRGGGVTGATDSAPVSDADSASADGFDRSSDPRPIADQPTPRGRLTIPGGDWIGVAPRYMVSQLVITAVFLVIVVAAWIVTVTVFDWWPVLMGWIGGVLAGLLVLELIITPRIVRAIRYQLREDDLLFRKGIMWQRFVAVPYGRMQLVDINRGPLSRALGLAELKLVTAASATYVTIPGLPRAQALELRDHLIAVAESRRSGL